MLKKTIKINFKYLCEGFNPEDNFFTNLLKKRYNVVISDSPDYIIYSVYPKLKEVKGLSEKGDFIRKISPRLYLFARKLYVKITNFGKSNKLLVPQGKFVKIFFTGENVKPNMGECDWAFSPKSEENFFHPRHMWLPTHVANDFQLGKKANPPIQKNIHMNKVKKEKIKFCNFIYSQEIPFRNDFFKKLSRYKKIDAPGRCMNNMSPIGSHLNAKKSRSSKNWVIDKLNFLKKYKFTIAFENASVLGYTTEKLTHPMLVNSIPIYFGNKNVKKEFNTKSFINYHDFENMDKFIEYIIKVDNDDKLYERILKEPWYNNNKIPEQFKEEMYLKRFKKIFG